VGNFIRRVRHKRCGGELNLVEVVTGIPGVYSDAALAVAGSARLTDQRSEQGQLSQFVEASGCQSLLASLVLLKQIGSSSRFLSRPG
jgi:hypothetical protein